MKSLVLLLESHYENDVGSSGINATSFPGAFRTSDSFEI